MGSAGASLSFRIVCILFCLMTITKPTLGAIYTVGDTSGWTYNVTNWTHCKHFKAGDVLAFNYNKAYHNVVPVNKEDYENCTSPDGAKVYQTGKDSIELSKGPHYFICGMPGHCQSGMKISVNAA